MTLGEFKLNRDNHFVAMEYHTLILNRTLLLLLTDAHLIGITVNGLIGDSARGHDITGMLVEAVCSAFAIKADKSNANSFVNQKFVDEIRNVELLSMELKMVNKANFCVSYTDIGSVEFDPKPKWGMGSYLHDGKIYISTSEFKREFIILGSQSGSRIRSLINGRLKRSF